MIATAKVNKKLKRFLSCLCLASLIWEFWALLFSRNWATNGTTSRITTNLERARKVNIGYPLKWDFPVGPTDEAPVLSSPSSASDDSSASESRSGRHTCSCLDSTNPTTTTETRSHLAQPLAKKKDEDFNFRWLHIPKTGTSLIITLWLHATSTNKRNIPQVIDTDVDPYFRVGCTSCFDLVLMQRYPLELFGHNMHLRRPFASLHTSHEPLGALLVDRDNTTKHLVFFREPKARVVSAFDNNMHSYGNYGEHAAIKARCAKNVTCYADRPGQLGCMLRMLTGATCSVRYNSPHTMSLQKQASPNFQVRVQRGKEAIRRMAFIGLTEEWNESLCRFHEQFGGVPLQAQFQNVRQGSKRTSVADLSPSYKDPADEAIYQFAKNVFEKRIAEEGGRCYQFIEDNNGPAGGKTIESCVPKTCKDMGKQCGEWPDGCGGIRICGICNLDTRDSLPDTWRLQCSPEGECIKTCPPWEQAGLWHRPLSVADDPKIQEAKWKSRLHGAPEHVINDATANGAMHLFPTDAVRMCVGACTGSNKDAASTSFASKYCQCGTTPTSFLVFFPTAVDYQDVYNLKPSNPIYKSKPLLANLKPSDTQPKCCPPIAKQPPPSNQTGIMPPNNTWRKGIPLADFFEAYYLGCGGRDACEKLGHLNKATVVSHDPDHHFCYLGRDHRRGPRDYLDHPTRHFLILH